MRIKIPLLLLYIFSYIPCLFAQKPDWQEIQNAINGKINLAELHQQLEQIKKDAFKNNQYAIVARSFYHQMQIADLKSEDTSYFRNSFYIDSILKDKKTPLLLQSAMLILKAKRVAGFRHKFNYRNNKNIFWIPDGSTDYRKLNNVELDSLTQLYFEEAKKISLQLKQENVKELLWLSTDPLLFLFKPNYTDIIFAEQLHYADANVDGFTNNSSEWLLLNPDEFINSKELPKGLNTQFKPIYILYQQWANCHKAEPEIFYFIESLSRKYFYNKNSGADTKLYYQDYLQEMIQSKYDPVKAHCIYQLCLLWYNKGNTYSNSIDEYENNYSRYNFVKFDTAYRHYYIKALNLFEKSTSLLDSFYYLKKNLMVMKQQIESKKLNIQKRDVYLPNEKIFYHLVFKNITALHLKIVKLNSFYNQQFQDKLQVKELIRAASFKRMVIVLPGEKDFQTHAAKIETGSLPVGYYAVLYSDSLIEDGNQNINLLTISISNIAVVNNEDRLFVLNRSTGMPLNKAKVLVKYTPKYKGPIIDAPIKTVNAAGYTIVKERNINKTFVMYGADTLQVKVNENSINKPDEVFDKEEDELLEYYEDNTKLLLFTDRAIYRPGQTVYFKGILITRNPVTGERVILNKGNLKFSIWQRLFDNEAKEFIKPKLKINLNDAFNKSVDSLSLSPNEFGSVTGKFKISEKAATGDWEFDTDDIDIDDENDGHFKVEEYKRPSFEITLEKPTIFLQLGDSFFVKVKVKSFAGASLNNIKIKYDVNASFSYAKTDSINDKEADIWQGSKIADTSGFTNNDGELLIKIPSHFLKAYQFPNKKYYEVKYSINAEAIDATGESHEESLDIRLSNRPVKVNFTMANVYERSELGLVAVTAKNEFSGSLAKQVEATIYKVDRKVDLRQDDWGNSDYEFNNNHWIYKVENRNEEKTATEKKTLVYQAVLVSNTEKLQLPKELLESGNYRLEVICRENGNIVGEKIKEFLVFDQAKNIYPDTTKDFQHLPINMAAQGEKIKWYLGNKEKYIYSIYQAQYFAKTGKGIKAKYTYQMNTEQAGIKEWNFTIPDDAMDQIELTHVYIFNNKLYKETKIIYVKKVATEEPELIVEQYRRKLTPGSKETFVVMIKSKNENIAAELMTTMYDASLDKIEKHLWYKPNDQLRYSLNESWQNEINGMSFNPLFEKNTPGNYLYVYEKRVNPLWWLNPSDYAYDDHSRFGKNFTEYNNELNFGLLSGKAAGISIAPNALNEAVVVGYGSVKRNLTGSVGSSATITIRGISSFGGSNSPMVIMDGVAYSGDLSKINPESITDVIILKGADATAVYGSRAANGVILISTKGSLQLPPMEEPPVIVRKNFSETAFFLPQIHADADGYYNITFTIPESVTEWNWKMLAYTKDAKFVDAQKTIVTQIPMMVQPNMPRFLYQSDVINLQTRITNLDTLDLSGTASCMIEDAVTGEDITAYMINNAKQNFTVGKKSNNNIAYKLTVPENLLHPLKIRISARAGSFSDGEEYTIPILNKKILVSQNIPFVIINSNDTIIQSPALPKDAVPYGIGMHISPKPQAAIVNVLPYMAFYPYNCAEQTFNKMLAYSIALKIIQTDSAARQTMKKLELQPEANAPASLPDELSEQTMPWLQLNHQTQLHQQQLLKIFDTVKSKNMIKKYLNDLAALQNKDGGITWFPGGKSSNYISCYLLGGFSKLKKDSFLFIQDQISTAKFNTFLPLLVSFTDDGFTAKDSYDSHNLFYLYSRSSWVNEFPLPANAILKADSVLSASWKSVNETDLERQALLIITSLRLKGKENIFYQKAIQQIESIRQLAICDNVNGMRWKDISNTDDLDGNDEEAITLLAMAFEAAGDSKNTINAIIQWLLKAKEQHSWGSTKATAAVVGLLYKQQSTIIGSSMELMAVINDSSISVTDNLLKGSLFEFKRLTQFPVTISLKKDNNTTATGGLNFYYFTATPSQNKQFTNVKISKQLFRLSNISNKWELIDNNDILKIADKIKTIITIDAPRQLKYVFIDEKIAALLEPTDAASGYEYGANFSYYKSVRDIGYQFFAEQIPSGISTLSYETTVAKEGSFSNGPVSLQCMYQPQVRSYGIGKILTSTK